MVVARAGVPARNIRIGAELHHAERNRCARKGMTVAAGPDERINVTAKIGHRLRIRGDCLRISSPAPGIRGSRLPGQGAAETGQQGATEKTSSRQHQIVTSVIPGAPAYV